jgi:hypothetical protein
MRMYDVRNDRIKARSNIRDRQKIRAAETTKEQKKQRKDEFLLSCEIVEMVEKGRRDDQRRYQNYTG